MGREHSQVATAKICAMLQKYKTTMQDIDLRAFNKKAAEKIARIGNCGSGCAIIAKACKLDMPIQRVPGPVVCAAVLRPVYSVCARQQKLSRPFLKEKPFYSKVKLTNFCISNIRAAKNPGILLR